MTFNKTIFETCLPKPDTKSHLVSGAKGEKGLSTALGILTK